MKGKDRTAVDGDVDACAKPEKLALLSEELQRLTALGFGAVAVAATYPCDNHGCHCAFASGLRESATETDLQSLIDGLRANLRGLETTMARSKNPP